MCGNANMQTYKDGAKQMAWTIWQQYDSFVQWRLVKHDHVIEERAPIHVRVERNPDVTFILFIYDLFVWGNNEWLIYIFM